MSIPAVAPPAPPPQAGYPPGTVFSQRTVVLDDSGAGGSGVVITFGAADADRVAWRVTGDLSGWDSASLDETSESRTGADGAWNGENYYGGRVITLEGVIEAPDAATLDAAKAKLDQVLPPRDRLLTFTVTEAIPKQVLARRSGRLMMSDATDRLTQFSVSLLALDPRKYATVEQSASASLGAPGGGVAIPLAVPMVLPSREAGGEFFAVENGGTYETPVTVRIVGPGRSLGIANLTTGQSLSYPFDLATGDELVIDTNVGAAMLNGTAYRSPAPGSTVTGQFMLPPGTSQMQMLGTRTVTDVTPLLTMTWRDAWT